MANADRIIELLHEAKSRPAGAERERFLTEACMDDAALKEQILSLLEADADEGKSDFLKINQILRPQLPPTEKPGDRIGRYKLLEQIGEGGCGVVYMAEQEEPVRRRVALKVIKLGMDTKQVIARFEAERQALALMDHPNIAKIFDAGVTGVPVAAGILPAVESGFQPGGQGVESTRREAKLKDSRDSQAKPGGRMPPSTAGETPAATLSAGRPYFVMELVRGIKITDYCDQNNLTTKERLELFIQVCQAIQHAHQKGIIHRDIKPSNILVTRHDDVAVPKVIDFGIAKATNDQRLTDKTVFTAFAQFVGTPAYMSPEQAQMSGLDIDTRADIYSLGVLLYELLTGSPPFDQKELLAAGLDEMRRTIREVEPAKPSTRLTQELVAADVSPLKSHPECAQNVRADSRRLLQEVKGDLDWIAMKCLEKDRTRRYETANGLAMDIRRHLDNEPITARPPSRLYEFQKTVRRHKFGFGAATALIVVLGLGALVSTWQAVRATRARQAAMISTGLAEQAQEKEHHQRELAEVRLYAADMNAAQQAFDLGNLGRARDLLTEHWPERSEPDLRGFEWRYLWNLCRGDQVHTFPGHSTLVQCVAFSPDGKTLASGSRDSSVKLWDVANRKLVATLPAHSGRVAWLAFSNDGATLATAGDDGLIKLWNVKTHQLIFALKEEKAARIAFSPVGTLLAIGYGHSSYGYGYGGPMKLWDYVTHQVVKTFPEPGSRLAFSPDGRILAARSDKDAVKLWNVETGQEMSKLDKAGEVICLCFSSDGQTLAAGNWAGGVQLWNVATGERMLRLEGHATTVWSLAFSPDGKRLATSSSDQTLRLWNVTTGKEESKLTGHGSEVWAVAFAPDGQTLASGGKDAMVMLWSTAPKRAEVVLTNVILPPSFSPDSKLLATAKKDESVTVWDVATRQPVWVLNSERFGRFLNEGETLATISTNFILRFWAIATQTLQRAVPLPGITDSTRHFRFAMRGNRLAAEDEDGFITLYEATTGGRIGKFNAHAGPTEWHFDKALTFSPDARLLATSSDDQLVKLWDVATQRELAAVSGHKGTIPGLAFSPDGSLLASASYDDTVGFLRVTTGNAEAPLTGIKEGCAGVEFSPDGRTLAVACEDGTVRLWNLATKRAVAVLRHGKAPLRSLAFSPDGHTLVSVCERGTLRFWDAPTPDVPRRVKTGGRDE